MSVPFFDLKRQYLQLEPKIKEALDKVMQQTAFSGGPFVEAFEAKLATYQGCKYAVCLNSGTSALHLAMLALGIGEGDEVIVPANTFIATAWGVSYVNATPIFVDCDAKTWNLDPAAAEKAITPRTKAIAAVHLYGQPANLEALQALCNKYNIHLIEDNAQAIGAKYKGKIVGNTGIISCTSFYPGKNLGCYGEGGAAFTNDENLAKKMRMLRNHGAEVRYYHDEVGYNYRMEGFQAAVLDVKLNYIDGWNERRREIANEYKNKINNPHITWQAADEGAESVYHIFVITTQVKKELLAHLDTFGIGYAFHYPVPCHLQKAYSHLGYKLGDFPNSEFLAENCISLPMFPEMTDEELNSVISAMNQFKLP